MSRLLVNLSLFLLGVALAVMFAYRRSLTSFVGNVLPVQAATQPFTADVAERSSGSDLVDYTKLQAALMERNVTFEHRARVLSAALSEGTLDALQLLRSEYLSFLPDYRDRLLPLLKERALGNLLIRFNESDWTDWPSSAVSDQGGPTEARLYVDDVSLVNAELGRFLETAAQLYHGLYLSMMSGQPYSLEHDMYAVIQNAEKLLRHRRYTAVPARVLLDPGIVKEPLFLNSLEDMRGRLWLLYIERSPQEVLGHIKLLEGIRPDKSDSSVAEAVRQLLYRLSLEATDRLRSEAVTMLGAVDSLTRFAAQNAEIRQALAELYVISAVDAIEHNQLEEARTRLALSEQTVPGLRAQEVVRTFLDSPRDPEPADGPEAEEADVAPSEEAQEDSESALSALFSPDATAARRGLEQMLVLIVILAVPLIAGGRFFLAYLARRNLEQGTSAARPESEPAPAAAAEEIEFEDLSLDDGADQLKAAVNR